MFANPIWSVLILAGMAALYWFVIRPKAPFLEVGKDVTPWWRRWLMRLQAFRTYVAGAVGALLISLPDIIVSLSSADFSAWIGPDWSAKVTSLFALFALVNRAVSTTPPDEKA